jgi:hypothetical protein
MAKMVLHSEQRKRPGLVALSFVEQMGQLNTLGKTPPALVRFARLY